jgi:hypothetical protein
VGDLFTLLRAAEDINKIDALASRERSGCSGESWVAGEAGDAITERVGRRVYGEDLPASSL